MFHVTPSIIFPMELGIKLLLLARTSMTRENVYVISISFLFCFVFSNCALFLPTRLSDDEFVFTSKKTFFS